jgi:hypothetical protein
VSIEYIWGGFPWPFFIATSGFFACILAEHIVADVLARRAEKAQRAMFTARFGPDPAKGGSSRAGSRPGSAIDFTEPLLGTAGANSDAVSVKLMAEPVPPESETEIDDGREVSGGRCSLATPSQLHHRLPSPVTHTSYLTAPSHTHARPSRTRPVFAVCLPPFRTPGAHPGVGVSHSPSASGALRQRRPRQRCQRQRPLSRLLGPGSVSGVHHEVLGAERRAAVQRQPGHR